MNRQPSIKALAGEIRDIYCSNDSDKNISVEKYLEERLEPFPMQERLQLLEHLLQQFQSDVPQVAFNASIDSDLLSKLISLLLGKRSKDVDFSSEELMEKLANSLNTVFDSLNELVNSIHATLMGKRPENETIRFFIGSHLGEQGEAKSIESYLDQIKEAFSIAHQAFKDAAYTKMKEIMAELEPNRLSDEVEGGMKFGPLRKAQLFDIYTEKYRTLTNWLESGLLMEALLREFERISQRLYSEKREGK
jgi:hypothetical protein